jgi:hypothetical protein
MNSTLFSLGYWSWISLLLWMWFLNVWDNVTMDLKYACQQYFTCMCFLGHTTTIFKWIYLLIILKLMSLSVNNVSISSSDGTWKHFTAVTICIYDTCLVYMIRVRCIWYLPGGYIWCFPGMYDTGLVYMILTLYIWYLPCIYDNIQDKCHKYKASIMYTRQVSYIPDKYHIYKASIIYTRQVSYIPGKHHIYQASITYTRQVSYIQG